MTILEFFVLLRKAWFWIGKVTMHQILNKNYYNVSKFELKVLKRLGAPKKVAFKKSCYEPWCPVNAFCFSFFLFFSKRMNLKEILQRLIIRFKKFMRSQIFRCKILKCGRFWTKSFTKFQIWIWKNKLFRKLKKKLHSNTHFFKYVTPWKRWNAFVVPLQKTWFWIGSFTLRQNLK